MGGALPAKALWLRLCPCRAIGAAKAFSFVIIEEPWRSLSFPLGSTSSSSQDWFRECPGPSLNVVERANWTLRRPFGTSDSSPSPVALREMEAAWGGTAAVVEPFEAAGRGGNLTFCSLGLYASLVGAGPSVGEAWKGNSSGSCVDAALEETRGGWPFVGGCWMVDVGLRSFAFWPLLRGESMREASLACSFGPSGRARGDCVGAGRVMGEMLESRVSDMLQRY